MKLKVFQSELKDLLFFQPHERRRSRLWGNAIPARLEVYRHNTRTNWTDTLDHDFPLTRRQFDEAGWARLRQRYFIAHPPAHWELNASMAPFPAFLAGERVPRHVKELADFEWHDLQVFIDKAVVKPGSGRTNPTAAVRVYQHQLFFWVDSGAPRQKPPRQKPEVLIFYRDSRHTCHIREADPLMLLLLDHYRQPKARLGGLEAIRRRLLPTNQVPLSKVLASLKEKELIL